MLIKLKKKNPLAGIRFFWFRIWVEQVLQRLLDKKRTEMNAHDFLDVTIEFHLTFKYGHHAVGANGNIDLYSDNGPGVSQISSDTEMLIYPFEEQLDLPAMLVKKSYRFCREIEIVSIECVRMFLLRYIGKYSAYLEGIVFHVTLSVESNRLIQYNGSSLQQKFIKKRQTEENSFPSFLVLDSLRMWLVK